ncbi:MAG: hypothetical protein IJU55_03795 [Selenomonadaceae bacterium]|nr:hypothetical protein [Selenomonadaceae bacterium]
MKKKFLAMLVAVAILVSSTVTVFAAPSDDYYGGCGCGRGGYGCWR